MMYSMLADALLVLHFAFIAFVVGGQGFIVIGIFRRWRGVRSVWFRTAHLVAIGVVAVQAWIGAWCPLTLWENQLREAVGQSPYSETFIQYWFGGLVFHDAPAWAFTAVYTLFGAIVLVTWDPRPPLFVPSTDERPQTVDPSLTELRPKSPVASLWSHGPRLQAVFELVPALHIARRPLFPIIIQQERHP